MKIFLVTHYGSLSGKSDLCDFDSLKSAELDDFKDDLHKYYPKNYNYIFNILKEYTSSKIMTIQETINDIRNGPIHIFITKYSIILVFHHGIYTFGLKNNLLDDMTICDILEEGLIKNFKSVIDRKLNLWKMYPETIDMIRKFDILIRNFLWYTYPKITLDSGYDLTL